MGEIKTIFVKNLKKEIGFSQNIIMNVEAERPKSTNRFNIKNQSIYGVRQRQVDKDKTVLESFSNTSVMNNVLKMPRKTFSSGLLGISSGKEQLKQAIETRAKEGEKG